MGWGEVKGRNVVIHRPSEISQQRAAGVELKSLTRITIRNVTLTALVNSPQQQEQGQSKKIEGKAYLLRAPSRASDVWYFSL
jgi:hypothetical protein